MRRLFPGPLLVLAVVALVLAGCGSGDSDADDVPTMTTQPSPTSPDSSSPGEAQTSPTSPTGSSKTPSASADRTTTPPATETTPPASEPTAIPTTPAGPDDLGPTTYGAALARVDDLSGSPVRAQRFHTPGDVVYCVLGGGQRPACELRVGAIKDPDTCANALADAVGRIAMTSRGVAVPQCNTDTIREVGARTVRPKAVVASGDLSCAVESIGVTCIDRAHETGFFLTQGEYHVF